MAVIMRSVVTLAIFASLGSARRHNFAKVVDVMKHVAEQPLHVGEEPPDVDAMLSKAMQVVEARKTAAQEKYEAAQETLNSYMSTNMSRRNPNRHRNNTRGRNASKAAIDDLYDANNALMDAQLVDEKVKLMREACMVLIKAVLAWRQTAASERHEGFHNVNEEEAGKLEELERRVVEAEKLDLTGLLDILAEIRAAESRVQTLDEEIGAGAAEGIQKATELVFGIADQLQARKDLLDSDEHNYLAARTPLETSDAALNVDRKGQRSLQKAKKFLEAHERALNSAHKTAQEKLQDAVTMMKTNTTSKSELKQIVDEMYEINDKIGKARELGAAIDEAIQAMTNFFELFRGYRTKQAADLTNALKSHGNITRAAEEKRHEVDESILSNAGAYLHLYMMMWKGHQEAGAAIPKGDAEFEEVQRSIDATANAIHAWLNGEMMPYCTRFPPSHEVISAADENCKGKGCSRYCQEARNKITKMFDDRKAHWCDERFTSTFCLTTNNGHQPNGKSCKWINPDLDKGIQGYCKQVNPPTRGLIPYGRGDPTGEGIFY